MSRHDTAFRRPLKRAWFTRNPVFARYMIREASSVFLLLYGVNLWIGLLCLALGPGAWGGWAAVQAHPLMLAFAAVTLVMALVHSVTWFQVAPKAMPQFVGGRAVPPGLVTGALWAAFLIVTGLTVWLVVT